MKSPYRITLLASILCFLAVFSAFAQDRGESQAKFMAHGPRLGLSVLYSPESGTFGISEEENVVLGVAIPAVISQFGYHIDFSVLTVGNVNPVIQLDALFGGVEQGLLIPSLTAMIGIRVLETFEFGIGPNLSLGGTGVVAAVGYNIVNDNVYFPINLAVAFSQGRLRFTLLSGFNFP